jgi:hypothetical protein
LLELPAPTERIGELAQSWGDLTADQVDTVLAEQERSGERFGAAAIRLGLLGEAQLVRLLTLQQEAPKQLAATIIRLGLLAPEKAAAALEQYLAEQTTAQLATV